MPLCSFVKVILLVSNLNLLVPVPLLDTFVILPDKFQSQRWLILMSEPHIQIEDGLV